MLNGKVEMVTYFDSSGEIKTGTLEYKDGLLVDKSGYFPPPLTPEEIAERDRAISEMRALADKWGDPLNWYTDEDE